MTPTLLVLLLTLGAEPPKPPTSLPSDVRKALAAVRISARDKGFLIPDVLAAPNLVRGDFDGDGYEDWAIIVGEPKRSAILVAYHFPDGWRAGSIDVWGGSACRYCSQGPRPLAVSFLPPGSHDRVPGDDSHLLVNERLRISSQQAGILVTLADGSRRAYYLHHAWAFVDLGSTK